MSKQKLLKAEQILAKNGTRVQHLSKTDQICVEDTKSLPLALKEKVSAALVSLTEGKVIRVLSALANTEEIRKEILKVVNRETTYIARIPKKLKADMDAGLLDFMVNKETGEKLGILVNDKHKTQGIMQINEAKAIDIASDLANIAIQQQLASMTDVINDVRSRVIALQEGHDADLFGSIKGMHQQLLQMRDAQNPETKKLLTANAISVLNETRGKIEVTILNTLRELDITPDTDMKILGKIAADKNFLSDTIERYDRIEELFSYYVTATQLLGYSYAFLDEPASYEDIFTPSNELIANTDLQKLIAAENLYNEDIGETWYKNPTDFLLKIKQTAHSVFAEPIDVIEIEISGNKLLEVIENECRKQTNDEDNQKEVSGG